MKQGVIILSLAVAIVCGFVPAAPAADQPDQATQDQNLLAEQTGQASFQPQQSGDGSPLWSGSALYGPMWFDLLFSEANPPLSNVVEIFRQAQANPDNSVDPGLVGLSGAEIPEATNTNGIGMFGLSGTEMPERNNTVGIGMFGLSGTAAPESGGFDPFDSSKQNLPFERAREAGTNGQGSSQDVQEPSSGSGDAPTGLSVSYSSSTGTSGTQGDSSQGINPFASGEGGVPEEGINPFDNPAADGSTEIDQGINPFGSNS